MICKAPRPSSPRRLEVDREDSRLRAAHVALARLIEEAARQAKAKQLLENARKEIGARHFTAAMEALAEVERVDPSNPDLMTLQAAAKSGREQEQRRRILDQLQNEVSLASTFEELTRAAQLVDQALERMPTEPILMKFKGHLARRLREVEIRRRVDQVALRCRDLMETSPAEALQLVRDELQHAPGNERLLALQAGIVGQISERSQEQSRAEYMTRAHEALSSGRYLEALHLLESCQKEGIFSPEIAELMDFARQEADQHLKTSQLRGLLQQAQELMTQGSYRAVVDLLTPVSADPAAASLNFLLEDARSRLQSFQRDVDAALQMVDTLTTQEHYAEAVKFLEAQAPSVLESEPVQTALKRLRAAQRERIGGPARRRKSLRCARSPRHRRWHSAKSRNHLRIRPADANRARLHGPPQIPGRSPTVRGDRTGSDGDGGRRSKAGNPDSQGRTILLRARQHHLAE